ncbi:hypothetical protein EV421DRAFT_1839359 [Armillaria borealis]|uniref:Uncharacterized protein n=1 Tax=Armillaria borealis TaxID=47425 RepID=A0AA39J2Z5_9AGAR|nr:hypothetical protein EV421DRAFT_1839359 [Armillaria borealis]
MQLFGHVLFHFVCSLPSSLPNNGPVIRIAVNLIPNPMHFIQLLPPSEDLTHISPCMCFNEMNEQCLAGDAAMWCCPCVPYYVIWPRRVVNAMRFASSLSHSTCFKHYLLYYLF